MIAGVNDNGDGVIDGQLFHRSGKKIVDIFDNGMNQKILNISVNF